MFRRGDSGWSGEIPGSVAGAGNRKGKVEEGEGEAGWRFCWD
jgi:hypothetical protein